VTNEVQGSGDNITIRIISFTDIDVSKLTSLPLLSGNDSQRRVVFLEVENKSDKTWEWEEFDIQFATKEGYVMDTEQIRVPSENIPKGWHSSRVEIPPSSKAKIIVVLGKIDENTQIDYLLYKTKLAEEWYSDLSSEEVRDYSDKYERVKIDIPDEKIPELDNLPDDQK
jgi:hypothetical protein